MYVLRGKPDGSFATPEKILDKAGAILRLGQFWDDAKNEWAGVPTSKFKEQLGIGAAPVDWDDDGDLDLVIGANEGGMFLRKNVGTKAKPEFETESERIDAGGAPINVPGSHAIPSIADWDGDGLFDILSGGGEGGAVWYRNTGKKGAPAFASVQTLVAAKPPDGKKGTIAEPAWPGERTQVTAADFDGDGDLDLLVGDYASGPWDDSSHKQPEMHGWVWLVRRK